MSHPMLPRCNYAVLFLLLTTACGDGNGKLPSPDPLPQQPQALPNVAFVNFNATRAGFTSKTEVAIINGGIDNLVVSDVQIVDDTANVFGVVSILPTSQEVESQRSLGISLDFSPPTPGVYLARLLVTSNAQNVPNLEFEIIGAATSNPPSPAPTVSFFEKSAAPAAQLTDGSIFVRFYNLGIRDLGISKYEIFGGDGAFVFPDNAVLPTPRNPACPCTAEQCPGVDCTTVETIWVLGRAFNILTLFYEPASAGDHAALFEMTTFDPNDPAGSVEVVPYLVTSQALTGDPRLEVFVSAVEVVDGQAAVRLANLGSTPLSISDYSIVNDTDAAFAFAAGTPNPSVGSPLTLEAGQAVRVLVDYTPPGTGTHTATVEITSFDPNAPGSPQVDQVNLSGSN
ncbi:MAG: choice-of-anchor D domain-containing protein [Myxococcota bacterium]